MQRLVSLFILILVFNYAFSQPADGRTLGDIAREKEHKAYQDAYMEGIRNSSYKPTITTGAGSSNASQELADLFARRAGRRTSAEKEAEENAATKLYFEKLQKENASRQKQSDLESQAHYMRAAISDDYVKAGFNAHEGYYLGKQMVTITNGVVNYAPQPKIFRAKSQLAQLRRIEDSASFSDVMQVILELQDAPAPIQCVMSLQKLAKRFPDKLGVINQVLGKSFRHYFIDITSFRSHFRGQEEITDKTIKYMIDSYEAFLRYDPKLAMDAFANSRPHLHPAVGILMHAKSQKDVQKVGEICRLVLTSPNPDDLKSIGRRDYYSNVYNRIIEVSQYNYTLSYDKHFNSHPSKILSPFTAQDIRAIASAQGVKPLDVIIAMNGISYYYDRSTPLQLNKERVKKWKLKALMKELAEAGDSEIAAILDKV